MLVYHNIISLVLQIALYETAETIKQAISTTKHLPVTAHMYTVAMRRIFDMAEADMAEQSQQVITSERFTLRTI